ncbi:hypothetical protein SAMN05192551_101736 [Tindallia magadiensis]|uniref:Uncharacterized protein n=1 Tax=Tindallia magadiensis TaxID=69895 RepID=A0A1I3BE63_9FIRM|nr:hypothetical protein SAMN05192551_101736 [Tindallia magadiensis]
MKKLFIEMLDRERRKIIDEELYQGEHGRSGVVNILMTEKLKKYLIKKSIENLTVDQVEIKRC